MEHLGPGPHVDEVHRVSLRAALLDGGVLELADPGESEDFGLEWTVLLVTTEATHHPAEVALFQATPLRILQAVRVLHRRGYHRLRARPGMSASGMYWRVTIASTDNDDGDPNHTVFYSTGGLTDFAGGHIDAATSPRHAADLILAALPRLEPTADDPGYAQWFEGLMRLVEREHALPVSYADYFNSEEGWEIGWCSGLRYPAPPASSGR